MTSPAIQMARECWYAIVRMPTSETTSEWYPAPASAKEIETFYARAQAQALRDAAEISDQQDRVGATGDELRRMADELESKK